MPSDERGNPSPVQRPPIGGYFVPLSGAGERSTELANEGWVVDNPDGFASLGTGAEAGFVRLYSSRRAGDVTLLPSGFLKLRRYVTP